MIYDMQRLKVKYHDYSNIEQKLSLEANKGSFVRIKRGLYSDDLLIDAPVIANICYGPSYISFEYVLSRSGLIPEYVSLFTSAVFGKKNSKFYKAGKCAFEYRSVPCEVFPEGISTETTFSGLKYKIACREKALCDLLYNKYPVRTIKDLKMMLFDDLRIDENVLKQLDLNYLLKIGPLYHSNTIKTFCRYIIKEIL